MNVEVVATDLGSLPDGGFEEQTPIFRTDQNFLDRGTSGAHSYQDLSFDNRLAFQVEGVISRVESECLIALTETLGFRRRHLASKPRPGCGRTRLFIGWLIRETLRCCFPVSKPLFRRSLRVGKVWVR